MSKEIKLNKGKHALVSDCDYVRVNQYKWNVFNPSPNIWYARMSTRPYDSLHRFLFDNPVGKIVDHVNGNGLDNRRENLRVCTPVENSRNRRMKKDNKSGYRGVFWSKQNKRWFAQIQVNYKAIYLGSFVNKIDAARAYDKAATKYHGKFASLNFPEP